MENITIPLNQFDWMERLPWDIPGKWSYRNHPGTGERLARY